MATQNPIAVLKTLLAIFCRNFDNFQLKVAKHFWNCKFYYICSPKKILWTSGMQFWQTCRNIFAGRPTFVCSQSERKQDLKTFFGIFLFPKRSFWQVECWCDTFAAKEPTKFQEFFTQSPKLVLKICVWKKNFSSWKWSPGHLEKSNQHPA